MVTFVALKCCCGTVSFDRVPLSARGVARLAPKATIHGCSVGNRIVLLFQKTTNERMPHCPVTARFDIDQMSLASLEND